MTVIKHYVAYRIEDGFILGSATGYWEDEAAAQADAMLSFGQYKPAAAYFPAAGEADPSVYDFKIVNNEVVPLLPNGIVLEIDGVIIDLEAMGIDTAHPWPLPTGNKPHVPVTLGQHVKIKNIPAGTNYIRKGYDYTTTLPLTTVSWVVAKTGNNFHANLIPYQMWDVQFDFIPS